MRLLTWTICSLAYVVVFTQAFALPKGMENDIIPLEVDQETSEDNSLSERTVDSFGEVKDVKCGFFIKQAGKSLYGFNTQRVENVAVSECWRLCAKERGFYCRSVDFNEDSSSNGDTTTCFLSSESASTQPDALDKNFNTDYYERACEKPEGEDEEGSGGQNIVI